MISMDTLGLTPVTGVGSAMWEIYSKRLEMYSAERSLKTFLVVEAVGREVEFAAVRIYVAT